MKHKCNILTKLNRTVITRNPTEIPRMTASVCLVDTLLLCTPTIAGVVRASSICSLLNASSLTSDPGFLLASFSAAACFFFSFLARFFSSRLSTFSSLPSHVYGSNVDGGVVNRLRLLRREFGLRLLETEVVSSGVVVSWNVVISSVVSVYTKLVKKDY